MVLAGSEDATVWMWNADTSVYLNMFSGHGSSVTCGDFTPDGTLPQLYLILVPIFIYDVLHIL